MRSIEFGPERKDREERRQQIDEMVAKLAILSKELAECYDLGCRVYVTDVLADAATILSDLSQSGELRAAVEAHLERLDRRSVAAAQAVADLEVPR
jgi:hypothetical protein